MATNNKSRLGRTALINFWSAQKQIQAVSLILFLTLSAFAQITNPPPNVWAWGDDSSGQCDVPASVTNAVAVAAGFGFSMALKADGTVVTWGTPQDFGFQITNAVQIAAGTGAWALLADGTYHVSSPGLCSNPNGFQMTIPSEAMPWSQVVFPTVSTISNVTSMLGLGPGSCVLLAKADGSLDYAGCFSMPFFGIFPFPPPCSGFASSGAGFTVWVLPNGSVGTFDSNIGNCDCYSGISPCPADLTNVTAVAANGFNPLALKSDGTLESWGGDWYKWGGDHRFVNYNPGISNIIAIAGNPNTANFLALRSDGVVIDTSTGTTANPSLPFAQAVSLGSTHALALIQPNVAVTPPVFLKQPQSQTIPVGGTVFLRSSALGFGQISYQWFFNQTNVIFGATSSVLEITNIQPQQAGAYTLVATNFSGSVTSSPALVSVTPYLNVFMVPTITMFGGIGTTYSLSYINAIGSTNNWTLLTTVTLTNSPQLYFDLSATGQPSRYYRLIQVP